MRVSPGPFEIMGLALRSAGSLGLEGGWQVCFQAKLSSIGQFTEARLAQSAERKALNLVVVGSSPTVGGFRMSPGREKNGERERERKEREREREKKRPAAFRRAIR